MQPCFVVIVVVVLTDQFEKSPEFLFYSSQRCPNPDQKIVAIGDAFNDITCANVSVETVVNPKPPGRSQFHSSCVLCVLFNLYSYLKVTIISCRFVSCHTGQAWPLVLSVLTSVVLIAFSIVIIVNVALKIRKKTQQETKKVKNTEIPQAPIIRTPTGNYYCAS